MAKDFTMFNIVNQGRGELFHVQRATELRKTSEFVVEAGEVAFIIKDGRRHETISSGRYEIFGKRDGLAGIFDPKRISSIKIAFVSNNTAKKVLKWGIPHREMEMRDPLTDVDLMMGAFGEMIIQVGTPEQFYEEWLTDKDDTFTIEDFQMMVLGKIKEKAKSAILRTIREKKIPYHEIDENTESLASEALTILREEFATQFGINVVSFVIGKISIPEDKKLEIRAKYDQIKAEQKRQEEYERQKAELKEVQADIERLANNEWEKEKYLLELKGRDYQLYMDTCKQIGWQPEKKDQPIYITPNANILAPQVGVLGQQSAMTTGIAAQNGVLGAVQAGSFAPTGFAQPQTNGAGMGIMPQPIVAQPSAGQPQQFGANPQVGGVSQIATNPQAGGVQPTAGAVGQSQGGAADDVQAGRFPCVNCNTPITAGDLFCSRCGQRQPARCVCGNILPDDAMFCSRCGTPKK